MGPDRGVSRVEVRIDNGSWQEAQLRRPISSATWVQWALPWQATMGRHTIEVRATDGTGEIQTGTQMAARRTAPVDTPGSVFWSAEPIMRNILGGHAGVSAKMLLMSACGGSAQTPLRFAGG
jgi:hypothetical protein